MSTINNISLRSFGEQQLERAKLCVPLYVSLMVSITVFSGFYFKATFLQTVIASFCALCLGLWHGLAEKLKIEKEAWLILAQSDLYHLLEVKTIKPEELQSSKQPVSLSVEAAQVVESQDVSVNTTPEKIAVEDKKSTASVKDKRKKPAQQPPQTAASKKKR